MLLSLSKTKTNLGCLMSMCPSPPRPARCRGIDLNRGTGRVCVPNSLRPHGLQPTQFLCPWDSPGKNMGVGCHALLPGDLPNPGIKPTSLMSPASAGGFFTTSATWEEPTLESYHHRNHAVFCARAEPQRDISVKGLLVTPQDIKRLGLDPKHSWLPLSCLAVYLPPTNI